MGTISAQIRENRKRSKKIAITITAIVLAAVIAGVAIFFVVKNNKKSEIISAQSEIVNYFRTKSGNTEPIERAIGTEIPTKDDFFSLRPKQTVKIEKITGVFWWIPDNYTEVALDCLPDTFETTIFTENFTVTKNTQMLKEVEITPKSCSWLKEIMTPEDDLSFMTGIGGQRTTIQIKNLQIFFSVV